jgi:Ca2+-binding RTX toxin-like protein
MLVWAGPASAALFFVSPAGSDANPGTEQLPWRTIAKANSTLGPGDTVFIMAGQYRERIEPARSGTAGNFITYAAYRDDTPVITAPPGRIAIVLVNRSFIRIDGLTVTGQAPFTQSNIQEWGLLQGANNNIVQNSSFQFAQGVQGFNLLDSDFNQFLNNRFDNVGSFERNAGDVIAINCSDRNLFEGNTMTRGGHNLMQIFGDRNVIRENVFNNRWGPNIGYRALTLSANRRFCETAMGRNLFEDNTIMNSLVTFDMRETVATKIEGTGQIMRHNVFFNNLDTAISSSIRPPTITEVRLNRIYNNTLYLSGSLWRINDFGNPGPANFNKFQNNAVVIAGDDEEIRINFTAPGRTPLENNQFIANAFHRTSGTERYVINGIGTVTLEFLQANFSQFFRDNIEAPPDFVSVNPDSPQAFRLQPGSPLINRGQPLTTTVAPGSGRSVPVADAQFFSDGFGVVPGDLVEIDRSAPVRVTQVDYGTETLVLDSAREWPSGALVSLPFNGTAPDIGAFESGEDEEPPPDGEEPPPPPTVTCGGRTATIVGTDANETITGTPNADVIHGLGGADGIGALLGNDVICGGAGNDTIGSGDDDDIAFGQTGDDLVIGGDGIDQVNGNAGDDRLQGIAGNDTLNGDDGVDALDGGGAIDTCNGGLPTRGDTAVNCERITGIP